MRCDGSCPSGCARWPIERRQPRRASPRRDRGAPSPSSLLRPSAISAWSAPSTRRRRRKASRRACRWPMPARFIPASPSRRPISPATPPRWRGWRRGADATAHGRRRARPTACGSTSPVAPISVAARRDWWRRRSSGSARLGIAAYAVIADSAGAAWAVARLGGARTRAVPEGGQRAALARSPGGGAPPRARDGGGRWRALGLRRIGDLYRHAAPVAGAALRRRSCRASRPGARRLARAALARCRRRRCAGRAAASPSRSPRPRISRRDVRADRRAVPASRRRRPARAGSSSRSIASTARRCGAGRHRAAEPRAAPSAAPHRGAARRGRSWPRHRGHGAGRPATEPLAGVAARARARRGRGRRRPRRRSVDRLTARLGGEAVSRPLRARATGRSGRCGSRRRSIPPQVRAAGRQRKRPVRLLARPEPVEAVAPVPTIRRFCSAGAA